MKKLKLLWLLPLALAVIFTMCKKDQEEQPRTVEISFSGDVMEPGGLKDGPPYDCMEVDADYAMIQIEGQTYKREVFYLEGKPYTQSIKFDLGTDASLTFTVEAFVLYYDNGTADESDDYPIAATPTVDGAFAEWVDKPLEFDIDVFDFEKIQVPIEVLCIGEEDVYNNFGYDWFLVEEIIIREECFFGDICLDDPEEYANSWYSQQGNMQIDMVAIFKIEIWRDSEYQGDGMEYVTEYSNMDFTNPDAPLWVPGPLCVQYGDYLYYDDDFEFRLFIWVQVDGGFDWVLYHIWEFSNGELIPEALGMEDGIVDFVLGLCAPDADYIFTSPYPLEPEIEPGEPLDKTTGFGFRIKGAQGPDCYLGVGDLGVGGNRVQADAGNPLADGTYPITFAYDQNTNVITLTGPASVNLSWDLDNAPAPLCTDWNAMVITIRDSKDNGGAEFNNVMLDAYSLGSFGPLDVPGIPGFQHWTVTGFDFTQSFTVTADLTVVNLNANESLKVEMNVICVP